MLPRLLLDTHVLVRWLTQSRRLPRTQLGALERAVQSSVPIAFSAITLIEIGMLSDRGKLDFSRGLEECFELLQASPLFKIFPLTYAVAAEGSNLASLKDPADRIIVATARVHNLRLVTSDQRIIESNLVPVIE